MKKQRTTDDLQTLPGIGPSMARDLRDLGFQSPSELRNQDPEKMYSDLCELRGQSLDRCVLYVFRCAVYAATSDQSDPELLKWWNWKDRNLRPR
jgi:hypothetical protein